MKCSCLAKLVPPLAVHLCQTLGFFPFSFCTLPGFPVVKAASILRLLQVHCAKEEHLTLVSVIIIKFI